MWCLLHTLQLTSFSRTHSAPRVRCCLGCPAVPVAHPFAATPLFQVLQPYSGLKFKLAKAGTRNATIQICYGVGDVPCGKAALTRAICTPGQLAAALHLAASVCSPGTAAPHAVPACQLCWTSAASHHVLPRSPQPGVVSVAGALTIRIKQHLATLFWSAQIWNKPTTRSTSRWCPRATWPRAWRSATIARCASCG